MSDDFGEMAARWRGGHHALSSRLVGRVALLLAGVALLALAVPPFFTFPWLGFWLVPLAAIYLFFLLLLPRLWLIVLPLATVGLDITPFTGRFSYNELDLLFLLTIGSGLLFGRYRLKVFSPSPASVLLFLYLAVIALGYSGWTFFAAPPGAEVDNPYYAGEYAYKSIKGMLWGVALVPMWGHLLAFDKRRAVNMLVIGMTGAAVLLGLIVLWERGSLGVVLDGSAWYHVVTSLLDLSSSYRVTGIFSDMHTGGEALDGVLLLLLPASLYAAANGDRHWLRIVGAVGALILAYVALVGFTRATYVAFAITLVLYGSLTVWSRHRNRLALPVPVTPLAASLVSGLAAAAIAYRYAGSYGLASYGALLLVAFCINRWRLPHRARYIAPALVLLFAALAAYAHFSSRWIEPSAGIALLVVASLLANYAVAHRLFRRLGATGEINRLFVLAAVLFLPVIFAFAVGGYQINERASRIGNDMEAREDHWQSVIDSAGAGFLSRLLGNGIGRFPANYISVHPETVRRVGSFSVANEDNRDLLRLGGGHDLTLGQRVTIEPFTNYTFKVHLRAAQPSRLLVSLCERNVIYASNFKPNCVRKSISFPATDGEFEQQVVEINSRRVGELGALWRWPTVMTVNYDIPGTVLDIDAFDLAADGFNILRNGSFKQDLDYWFYYNDFSHLPWHTKNAFLQVWFESGWLGLGLFLALLALLIQSSFQRRAHDSLMTVYTTGVLAVCIFGMFGSPLDSARVSWMFYFYLAAGLSSLRVRTVSRSRAAPKTSRRRRRPRRVPTDSPSR